MAQAQTKQLTSQTEPATTPLEALHRSRAQAAGELSKLNEAAAKLRHAAAGEAAVTAEIDELGRAETAEMLKWASNGCHGEAPRSDQQTRIRLAQKLNTAQCSAAAAKGAAADIDAQIVQQAELLALINEQIEQNILDQVEREHGDVIAEFRRVCERGSQLATQISGLALLFRETGNSQRAAVIFATKLPMVSTNPREVQLAADAWSRRISDLRKGSGS